MRVTIDVKMDDGQITRLEGVAGLAMMIQTEEGIPTVPFPWTKKKLAAALSDMPLISLRTDNMEQLAILLGCLMAFVKNANPAAYYSAVFFSQFVDTLNPHLRRTYPREPL